MIAIRVSGGFTSHTKQIVPIAAERVFANEAVTSVAIENQMDGRGAKLTVVTEDGKEYVTWFSFTDIALNAYRQLECWEGLIRKAWEKQKSKDSLSAHA